MNARPGPLKRFAAKWASWRNLLWFRVSVCFLLVSTLPLLVFAIIASVHTGTAIYGQTTRFSTELIGEVSRNIEREINALQNTSIDIAYNDDVQDLCVRYADLQGSELRSTVAEVRLGIAYKLTFNREVTDVILYPVDGEAMYLYGDASYSFRLRPEYEEPLLRRARENNGRLTLAAFSDEHQMPGVRLQRDIAQDTAECLMIARAMRSLPEGDILGVLVIRLNARFFNARLGGIDVGPGVQFMAYDGFGHTVLTTDEELFPTGEPLPESVQQHLSTPRGKLDTLACGGQTYIAYKAVIQDTGWTAVLLVPKRNLDREIWTIVLVFVLILLLVLLLVAVGVRVFHNLLNRPLIRLVNAMNAADGGNLNVEVGSRSADEIGQATRSFNRMLARIRQLLDDVKAEEKAKRTAELAALQAQINPHFLSNTLGTARLMAQSQKADNIDHLLAALIDLLHISMDMRDDLISLEEEVKYVRAYVEIMQYKNCSVLDVQYHIQPATGDILVPKLILQPLVENALLHGVADKGQAGQVVVRAVADGGDLHLTVTDNGNGMTQEKIEELLQASPAQRKNRFSGIGIPNVQERIRRIFGEHYGIRIDSFPQVFTSIELTMPIRRRKGRDAHGGGADQNHGCG